MMRAKSLILPGLLLSVAACTRPVAIVSIRPGVSTYDLRNGDIGDSRTVASLDVEISAKAARWIDHLGDYNTYLRLHRCSKPNDEGYPATAYLDGDSLKDGFSKNIKGDRPLKLTFYLPSEVAKRGQYDCGTLEARGYSPIFFKSPPQPLPIGLQFRLPANDRTNGS
jgi:hypothetical protein